MKKIILLYLYTKLSYDVMINVLQRKIFDSNNCRLFFFSLFPQKCFEILFPLKIEDLIPNEIDKYLT